jgi:hypothetical protein
VFEPRSAPATRSAIEPATRSMPSSRAVARAQAARAVERLGAGGGLLGRAEHGHFSGSTTSSRPPRRPRA